MQRGIKRQIVNNIKMGISMEKHIECYLMHMLKYIQPLVNKIAPTLTH